MDAVFVLLFFVLPVILLGFILWMVLYEGRKNVNATQWIVMKNGRTGALEAHPPGTHFFGPEWQEFMQLGTRMKPMKVENQGVRSRDGRRFVASFRFNIALGRQYRGIAGHAGWYEPVGQPRLPQAVNAEVIILAAALVAEEQLEERVAQALETAMEETVGHLGDEDLLDPSTTHPLVPDRPDIPNVAQERVTSSGMLYRNLASWIERIVHRELLPLGVTIIDFSFTDPPKYQSDLMQQAFEDRRRKRLIAEAANELLVNLAKPGDYSAREAIAAGTPAEGQVADAQSKRDASRNLMEGMRALSAIRDLIRITNNAGRP